MNQLIAEQILNIQEQLVAERALLEEYNVAQTAFLAMLPDLTESQRNILMDYLGVCIELHLRMLENAIEMK